MSKSIQVLHVFGQMTYGGAELRTLDVMRAIDPREVRFHFCTLSGQDGTLDDTIRAAGGTVNPCPLDLGFPQRFARLLTEREIDVVHSHVHYPSGLMMRVAARRRVPVRVTHFRNTHDGRRLTPRRRAQRALLRRWIDRYATDILAVSEGAMSEAWHPAGRRDGRCRVIYNGIDIEAFAGPADPAGVRDEFSMPADCPLIVHVGRMDAAKNHVGLVDIFTAIAAARSDTRLLLVGRGGGAIEAQVRATLRERGLDTRCVLAGPRADVPRLLLAADLMLFPSLWEGLPGAVIESAAAGTPVLASTLPGVEEIAAHHAIVHHLPLRAGVACWASAALDLLESRPTPAARAARLAEFARGPFVVERCRDQLRDIWERAA